MDGYIPSYNLPLIVLFSLFFFLIILVNNTSLARVCFPVSGLFRIVVSSPGFVYFCRTTSPQARDISHIPPFRDWFRGGHWMHFIQPGRDNIGSGSLSFIHSTFSFLFPFSMGKDKEEHAAMHHGLGCDRDSPFHFFDSPFHSRPIYYKDILHNAARGGTTKSWLTLTQELLVTPFLLPYRLWFFTIQQKR